MAIRKLLLPLMGTEAGEAALLVALMAARQWRAHVAAVHVRHDGREVMQIAGEGVSGALIEQMMVATEREAMQRAEALRAMFLKVVVAQGIAVASARPDAATPSADFAILTGRDEDVVAQAARVADCTVLARPDRAEDVTTSDALHAVLFDSGRPVLICPRVAPARLATRICLAWSGAAEAAAAARYGLPWMKAASHVTVLTHPAYTRRGPDVEALAAYLALHGINVDAARFDRGDAAIGPALLAAARDHGADMLIMGAYSSSRLRQLILGGTTRHVLEHADLPVLMCR